jgi:hypothetical protein
MAPKRGKAGKPGQTTIKGRIPTEAQEEKVVEEITTQPAPEGLLTFARAVIQDVGAFPFP